MLLSKLCLSSRGARESPNGLTKQVGYIRGGLTFLRLSAASISYNHFGAWFLNLRTWKHIELCRHGHSQIQLLPITSVIIEIGLLYLLSYEQHTLPRVNNYRINARDEQEENRAFSRPLGVEHTQSCHKHFLTTVLSKLHMCQAIKKPKQNQKRLS